MIQVFGLCDFCDGFRVEEIQGRAWLFCFIAPVGWCARDVGVFEIKPRWRPRGLKPSRTKGDQSVRHALIASAPSVSTRLDFEAEELEGCKVGGVEPWVLFVQAPKVYG